MAKLLPDAASSARPASPSTRASLWLALLALAGLYSISCWVRIHYTLTDPGFDTSEPAGLLKSDPGLLYYITERVIDAGGVPPADFRADPGPAWPERVDLPAQFNVGEEYIIAWAWKLFGGEGPLHVFIVKVMAIVASLGVVGVFGLAWELSRSALCATLAAALYIVLPYDYRTVGLILQREDLSFPLFGLHLWLAARAVRTGSWGAWAGAGITLALALETWHAMGFFIDMEVAALWLYLFRTGQNPLARPRAWLPIAIVAAGCFVLPVLSSKSVLVSPAMQGLSALWLAAWIARARPALRVSPRWLAPASLLGVFLLVRVLGALGGASQEDYGHVTAFLWAKLVTLGQRPADPSELPFAVRLLWQGPFETAGWTHFKIAFYYANLLAVGMLVRLVWAWIRPAREPVLLLCATLFGISLVAAWLVERTLILPAHLLPALAAWQATRPAWRIIGTSAFGLVLAAQATWFFSAVDQTHQVWYDPPEYTRDLRHLVHWADANLPHDEGVLGDFVSSTALLAHSRIPIVLQPKYEDVESRRRIEELLHHLRPRNPGGPCPPDAVLEVSLSACRLQVSLGFPGPTLHPRRASRSVDPLSRHARLVLRPLQGQGSSHPDQRARLQAPLQEPPQARRRFVPRARALAVSSPPGTPSGWPSPVGSTNEVETEWVAVALARHGTHGGVDRHAGIEDRNCPEEEREESTARQGQ